MEININFCWLYWKTLSSSWMSTPKTRRGPEPPLTDYGHHFQFPTFNSPAWFFFSFAEKYQPYHFLPGQCTLNLRCLHLVYALHCRWSIFLHREYCIMEPYWSGEQMAQVSSALRRVTSGHVVRIRTRATQLHHLQQCGTVLTTGQGYQNTLWHTSPYRSNDPLSHERTKVRKNERTNWNAPL